MRAGARLLFRARNVLDKLTRKSVYLSCFERLPREIKPAMRVNSYVLVYSDRFTEPQVGIIRRRITHRRFIVTVGEIAVTVSRYEIERMKPAARRAYRTVQRGN